MTLQSPSKHLHGLNDVAFNAPFTKDKPITFAYHGYPALIHKLTCRRTNHQNLHVQGFSKEGTTATPFDMVVLNGLDRFHLARAALNRVPRFDSRAESFGGYVEDKLAEHACCIRQHGKDMPEIRDWVWGEVGTEQIRPVSEHPTIRN